MSTNQELKDDILKTFDKAAKDYDNNKQFIISSKKLITYISDKNYTSSSKVLDLSTGTGNVAIQIAKKYPSISILGVDISSQMLSIAKRKINKLNIKNIKLVEQDVETLDFSKNEFDTITCAYGLFFFPNMQEVYKNICTFIKPSGQFIFSSFTHEAFEPYSCIFKDILENKYNISFPSELENKLLNTKEEVYNLAKLSNPSDVKIKDIEIIYDLTIEQWWDLLNSSGYKGMIMKLNPIDLKSFKEEYFKALKKYAKNETLTINANSYFCIISF